MRTYFNEEVNQDMNDLKMNSAERCTRFEKLLTMFSRPLSRWVLLMLLNFLRHFLFEILWIFIIILFREINRFNDYLNVMAQIINRVSQV